MSYHIISYTWMEQLNISYFLISPNEKMWLDIMIMINILYLLT